MPAASSKFRATNLASERGDATVLRREAAWWRAFAMSLAEAA